MSILADSQIRDLCQLPPHLVNFQNFLIKQDRLKPWPDGDTRVSRAQTYLPNLNPFTPVNVATSSDAPTWLRELATQFIDALKPYDHAIMIEPFISKQVRVESRRGPNATESETTEVKVVSYGLSSYGYDARLSDEIKTFTNINGGVINPKDFDAELCVEPAVFVDDFGSEYIIVPANGFVLGSTVEYFRVPKDVTVICLGKSTYARTGLVVNVTPLEAEWEGNVTLELSNTTPLPIMVFLNEGICQFLFLKGEVPCDVSYADRSGKYQGQRNITLPKV